MKMRVFLAVISGWALTFGVASAQTYTWSTIVGQPGVAGAVDGTNNSALFNTPAGMAIDKAGNLYISDHGNQWIRQVAPAGNNWVVTTMIGSNIAGAFGNRDGTNRVGAVNDPYGLGVDSSNNVFLADNYNKCIRKIKPVATNWVISTIAGSGNSGLYGSTDGTNRTARFLYVTGLAVDSSNNIYVVDTLNYTIREVRPFDGSGTNFVTSTIAGSVGVSGAADGTNGAAQFVAPSGIASDTSGNLYVADTYGNTIRMMKPVGTNWVVTTIAGTAAAGSTDGTNTAAQFNNPTGVVVDNSGVLYVTDSGNDTIRKMVPVGTNWVVSTIGGQALSPGTNDGVSVAATFNGPNGIVVGSNGTLFVEDGANNTVRQGIPVSPPSIASQPSDLAVTNGYPAKFYVGVTGTAPFFYQWQDGGTNLMDVGNVVGSATTNLILATTSPADANGYDVIVSNTWGSVTSRVAVLTIVIPPADSVGDGITDAWRAQYFGGTGTTTNSHSCATCDDDHTGQDNLIKFLAGLNPTNPASIFRILSVTPSAPDMLVTWQAGGGRTNVLQAASNVAGIYSNVSAGIILPGSGDTTTNYLDSGGATNVPAWFYRVQVVP